ncbi:MULTISPECIES: IS3 family transposase [Vibrio]
MEGVVVEDSKRIKVKLKGLTPIEYRTQALKAA